MNFTKTSNTSQTPLASWFETCCVRLLGVLRKCIKSLRSLNAPNGVNVTFKRIVCKPQTPQKHIDLISLIYLSAFYHLC